MPGRRHDKPHYPFPVSAHVGNPPPIKFDDLTLLVETWALHCHVCGALDFLLDVVEAVLHMVFLHSSHGCLVLCCFCRVGILDHGLRACQMGVRVLCKGLADFAVAEVRKAKLTKQCKP